MMPFLSEQGKAVLAVIAVAFAGGVAANAPGLLLLASIAVVFFSFDWLRAIALSHQIESGAVEVLIVRDAGSSLRRLSHARWSLRVENHGDALRGASVEFTRPSGLLFPPSVALDEIASGIARVHELEVEALAVGRWVIHGAHFRCSSALRLFVCGAYLRVEENVAVLPRSVASRASRATAMRSRSGIVGGARLSLSPGDGTELRELRDYMPGDSFRRVAWKQTARRGSLVVRENETRMASTWLFLLDVSSTMRAEPAVAKLEFARELMVNLADRANSMRDRFGALAFDESVLARIPVSSGSLHLRNVVDLAVLSNCIYDPETLDFEEAEVIEAVTDYLRVHERLEFRRGTVSTSQRRWAPPDEVYQQDRLKRWLAFALESEKSSNAVFVSAGFTRPDSLYLQFAQQRGLELPYRADGRFGKKAAGLAEAIQLASGFSRARAHIVVISDLSASMDLTPIFRSLRIAQNARHTVQFVVPFSPEFASFHDGYDETTTAVRALLGAAEARERSRQAQALRSKGAQVRFVGGRDAIGTIAESILLHGGR